MKRFLTILMTVLLLCTSMLTTRIVLAEDEEDNTDPSLETEEVAETEEDQEDPSEEEITGTDPSVFEEETPEEKDEEGEDNTEVEEDSQSNSSGDVAYAIFDSLKQLVFFRSRFSYDNGSTVIDAEVSSG